MSTSVWIMFIGAGVFILCCFITGTTPTVTKLIDAIGKMGFASFAIGLGAWLIGK